MYQVVDYELRVARVASLFGEILSKRGIGSDKMDKARIDRLARSLAEASGELMTKRMLLRILRRNEKIREGFRYLLNGSTGSANGEAQK